MHELGIANSILDGVAKEIERRPGSRPTRVGVRIGELAGVDPDALRFGFISGDELEFAYLEVEEDEPCAAGRKSPE